MLFIIKIISLVREVMLHSLGKKKISKEMSQQSQSLVVPHHPRVPVLEQEGQVETAWFWSQTGMSFTEKPGVSDILPGASADGVKKQTRKREFRGLRTKFLFLLSRQADVSKQTTQALVKVKASPFTASC